LIDYQRLIETRRLPNQPGNAAAGTGAREAVGLSAAWRTSSSLASALLLDQLGALRVRAGSATMQKSSRH
jgi:hypothetical protein